MSFFEKIVFKTFLILALICFSASVVFADTTYTYYQTLAAPDSCSMKADDVCGTYVSRLGSSATRSYSLTSCNTANNPIRAIYSYTDTYPASGNMPASSTTVTGNSGNAGYKLFKTCKDDEKFVLNGCTATCVVDPCLQYKDQIFVKNVSCGSLNCSAGSFITGTSEGIGCSPSMDSVSVKPSQTAVDINSCSGALSLSSSVPTGFTARIADIGSTSAQIYCHASYKHLGKTGLASPDQTGLASLSFMDVTETTEDGSCPSGTVKGSYAIGDGTTKWICVKDKGSEPDPTDPPPIDCAIGTHYDATTDKCVADTNSPTDPTDPNSQTCPTGQHKNASGDCVADTTGGGGGGGGGSGGSGGNPPNIDDTKGEAGSGSQTGAGGKATASTADGCGTPPSCSGDPLQCAAFVQDWKQNCQMMSVSQADADYANAMSKASNDELNAEVTKQNQKFNTFFSEFKTKADASLNSGACPNDVSLSVMGKQMTLKFSDSCFFWRLLRALVIASAYLAAARIVFSSFH